MNLRRTALLSFLFATSVGLAQTTTPWDTSGNALLKGAFNFRQVYTEVGDDFGDFGKAVAIWGTITFDGAGKYTIANSSVLDSSVGSVKSFSLNGTYAISASGFGFMDNPALSQSLLFGLVSQGVFISSATEDNVNDLFIAAQAPTTALTTASLTGPYWVSEMNFPTLNIARVKDAQFQINPNGSGGLGTITVNGYIGGAGTKTTQTVTGGTYAFSAGNGTISYGGTIANTTLLAGDRVLYTGGNQNFIFGGSTVGWDMFVGVKAASGATQSLLSGLYYQAGLDEDTSTLTSDGYATTDSYYGAFTASSGNLVGHQRVYFGFDSNAFDYTYSDTYTIAADGGHDDFFGFHNIVGTGGNFRIGFGTGNYQGITVALKAPTFTGPGVFLNPIGVLNGGSYVPFTVGVSRGMYTKLYGTNLAASLKSDATFPTSLNNVQVLVNGKPAPIYFVSAGEVDIVIPFSITQSVVGIQVVNNGTASNVVTVFRATVTPGLFTQSQNGLGYAASLHGDFTLVTPQKPARPGETIQLYMAGLGAVSPEIPDATPAPSNPLSKATGDFAALVGGQDATITFAGLAPGLIGLYQMNVTIPSTGVDAGDQFLDVAGPGAYSSQVILPIGASGVSAGREGGVPAQHRSVRGGSPKTPPKGLKGGIRRGPEAF